jgi:hypothetical protein
MLTHDTITVIVSDKQWIVISRCSEFGTDNCFQDDSIYVDYNNDDDGI